MTIDFVDLHAHSTYSLLDGHPTPGEMINKAVALGRRAHAITDHGSISGHVLFEQAVEGKAKITIGANTLHVYDGQKLDIKPIFGMEAYTTPDVTARGQEYQKKYHLSLLAKNEAGYKNLLQLTTRSWREGFYYRQSIDGGMLMEQNKGLIVLSGCETSNFMRRVAAEDWDGARDLARNYQSVFGDDFYIEIQHFPHTSAKAYWAWAIAEELGIKTVLTCDSHYLEPDGWRLQQFLWSIRDNKPVERDGFRIEHAYLWAPDELFAFCQRNSPDIDWQPIFENTVEVAEKIDHFKLPRAPHIVFPMEGNKAEYVYTTCMKFLRERGLENTEYVQRLQRELKTIADKGYVDYFLVVADMIRWAKSEGIFCGPARGSAAGSVICWALRITEVDPIKYGLMFERFVDPTRTDLPDIDNDFEDDRRHEVFAYMARRWGADNVAGITTFARLQGKSALHDVAKSYRIPQEDIDIITRHLVERSSGDQRAELTIQDTLDEFPEAREVWERHPALSMAAGIEGRLRHTGKHAAGLIVTTEPVGNYTAVIGQPGTDPLIAIDWRDSQYLNLMKIDCLGLKELTLLRLICGAIGWTLDDLYALALDDAETFNGFNSHDFLGVFQFTGLATKGVASRVHFEDVEQIADVNALSRPGPLHAGATEAYIRGKQAGKFDPILPQASVLPIIEPTYGQIIYQEQVMRILREVGGLSWQDVCDIRSIMGKTKGSEAFDKYWPAWEAGCASRSVPTDDAREIWECIRLYGKHSFNKAHALSYGIVAYYSMYMKRHYPREFYWAQLCKIGDDNVAQRFIYEAKRRGVEFANINLGIKQSNWYIDEDGRIAPGWQVLKGLGDKCGDELAKAAPYVDMADLTARVNKRVVNIKVRGVIEDSLGKTVDEIFGLDDWVAIGEKYPRRQLVEDVNAGVYDGIYINMYGRVNRINKKNRLEEYKSKGKDISRIDQSKPLDYVILIIEDETDSMMVYVSPELYVTHRDAIWLCEKTYVHVGGRKNGAIQMVNAQRLDFGIINTDKGKRPGSFPDRNGVVAIA